MFFYEFGCKVMRGSGGQVNGSIYSGACLHDYSSCLQVSEVFPLMPYRAVVSLLCTGYASVSLAAAAGGTPAYR